MDVGWMIESLVIDPLDSNHWLYGTGLTVFGGHDLTKWDTTHNVTINSLADGIEEFAVIGLASAPGGSELLAAVGDDSGFTFATSSALKTSPKTLWATPKFTSSTGVDYAGANVKNIVRVGGSPGTAQAALSTDGGATWFAYSGAGTTLSGGTVAYSANADTILWSTSGNGVQVSTYSAAFSAVSSLPASAVIASDKQNNTVFYGASGSSFYISTNKGVSFTATGALTGAKAIRSIAAHPKKAGEVWVSTDVGIFKSTTYGSSFTKVSTTITSAWAISLGLGSSGAAGQWNVYAFGTGPAGNRLYGSGDAGKTWTDIQGASQGFGAISGTVLAGSGNTPGQVFVGTNGRGVMYASSTL